MLDDRDRPSADVERKKRQKRAFFSDFDDQVEENLFASYQLNENGEESLFDSKDLFREEKCPDRWN